MGGQCPMTDTKLQACLCSSGFEFTGQQMIVNVSTLEVNKTTHLSCLQMQDYYIKYKTLTFSHAHNCKLTTSAVSLHGNKMFKINVIKYIPYCFHINI